MKDMPPENEDYQNENEDYQNWLNRITENTQNILQMIVYIADNNITSASMSRTDREIGEEERILISSIFEMLGGGFQQLQNNSYVDKLPTLDNKAFKSIYAVALQLLREGLKIDGDELDLINQNFFENSLTFKNIDALLKNGETAVDQFYKTNISNLKVFMETMILTNLVGILKSFHLKDEDKCFNFAKKVLTGKTTNNRETKRGKSGKSGGARGFGI